MSELWILPIMTWTVCIAVMMADTDAGRWITENRFSQRFIMPIWEQIVRPVHWIERKVTR